MRYVLGGLFMFSGLWLLFSYRSRRQVFCILTGLFYLCVPTVNPWYFLPFVPFILIYGGQKAGWFFVAFSLYYLNFLGIDPQTSVLIYGSLGLGIIYYALVSSLDKQSRKLM